MASKAENAHSFLLKQSNNNQHTKLYKLLNSIDIISINNQNEGKLYSFLIKTIVSQQLSTSAARTIWGRVKTVIDSNIEKDITIELLKSAGLSRTKSEYILGILDNQLIKSHSKKTLKDYSFNELSEMLLQIKGIGPWTLGITRMFYICDEDVWLDGDLGINKAANIFIPDIDINNIKEIYSPYRTYLSLYLWKGLDSL
tara:strand:- start:4447 stop:5043 length:597 start_codon:yes stop_codon:yes gene_type:complete